ncbi:MAG TPA: chromosome segregation protein SMC [Phycisphaerae bacterium]|nr:chromosome segregation protein SMC [Phycisphaerae bacterium]HNU44388.1 chromosome segregation protein SMC [Phycisphaerae bacterium]
MLLKRVSLCGFKSFCDKVDFDLGGGMTCIVGPNGCGKSNVVDAIKWVLGEQSAKSLRGHQMLDMVFNGSSTRRASSLAQVDLVFDNTDRSLPLQQDEVTITRKLYRSGESEYQLNREVSRLKDIRELFMDTGIGGDSYAVIEQGQVENLLQSNPQERRAIFEEAAGISKCRARKREAERKLERTEQNLLRVADIVDELEKRLRSVKLQAGKARSYREYEQRLNELRSTFALAEYHRFTTTLVDLARRTQQCTDRVTELRTRISHLEAQEADETTALDRLAEEIATVDNRVVRARAELAALEERIRAAQARGEEQTALARRAEERLAGDQHRLDETHRDLADQEQTASDLAQQEQSLHARLEELTNEDRARARDCAQAQAVLEDEKAGLVDLLRRSAQTHNEIIRLNTHQESLVGQKGRLHQRDAQVTSELGQSLGRRAELEARLAEVQELIAAETRRLEEKKAEAARIEKLRRDLAEAMTQARQRRSALESRRELLQDLQHRMEGIGGGARALLEAARHAESDPALAGIRGLVADLFETDISHAPMIEAALGEAEQALVLTHSGLLWERPELFAQLPGQLTVLALDRLAPVINERDFSDRPGFVARALELVRYDDRFEHVARFLLGKTIVVSDLAAALALAAEDAHGHRFVTLRGELLEPDGRISVGPPATRAGLISRKSELRDIELQLALVDEQQTTLGDQLNRTEAEAVHLESVLQELRTAIYESHTARVEANAALQGIAQTIERLAQEQPVIAYEVALLERQLAELHQRRTEGDRSLEAMAEENRQREQRVTACKERIDALVETRRHLQEELTQARVQMGQLAARRSAAADAIAALRRGIEELERSCAAARLDGEQSRRRVNEAAAVVAASALEQESVTRTVTQFEETATQVRHQREMMRARLEGVAQDLKQARGDLQQVESELHEAQMAQTEVQVRREELLARIRQELNVDLRVQYEQYQHTEQDWQAVETEIAELRGKIARLGNVNLDALTELEELEQRHGFLTAQRDDLLASKKQLEELIVRLDEEAAQRFQQTFEQIREHFRALFRKLFGGGRADVVLEDPEHLLDSGIEILAQPPGKEARSISLMSGGEKSLTAIALVMSMFKSRPAPFAILDEVDAALDEANNVRFNQLIQEFVQDTQFIVVTHSKRTMAGADQLYGITMQEPGVSTRVSVQFADAHVA